MTGRVVLDQGMRFEAESNSGQRLVLDAAAAVGGSGGGPTPKELLPIALGGCVGMDVISILRKMQQDVTALEVIVEAETAPEHPKRYLDWKVTLHLKGNDLEPARISRAIALSKDRYCSVSSSFDPTAPRSYYYTVNGSDPVEVTESAD
jgi:putative redox protein